MPANEEIANELEMQIVSLSEEYKKLITEMSKQREEIHREVDSAFNQMEDDTDEVKEEHHNILKNDLDEINQFQSLMQQTLLDLIEIDEFNKVTPTIQYSSKNKKFRKLPLKCQCTFQNQWKGRFIQNNWKAYSTNYPTGGESLNSKEIERFSRRIIGGTRGTQHNQNWVKICTQRHLS